MNNTKASRRTKKKQEKPQWVELGEVAVDSGHLVLTDPAYLQGLDGKQFYEQLSVAVLVQTDLDSQSVKAKKAFHDQIERKRT